MGRTIGAAIGAVIVVLFFATVKTRGQNPPVPSSTVTTSAQDRLASRPVVELSAPTRTARHTH